MNINQIYNVCMQTPIGKRYGCMNVQAENGRISGTLDILQHSETFCGTIDEGGICEFTGKIITLIHTMPYVATGTITEDSLNISLKCGKSIFELTGSAERKEPCI